MYRAVESGGGQSLANSNSSSFLISCVPKIANEDRTTM